MLRSSPCSMETARDSQEENVIFCSTQLLLGKMMVCCVCRSAAESAALVGVHP